MPSLRLIATTVVGLRTPPDDALENWLKNRLQKGASTGAEQRALSKLAVPEARSHFNAVPFPTDTFNAARAAPLRFPTGIEVAFFATS
jgi:hypothetical protein